MPIAEKAAIVVHCDAVSGGTCAKMGDVVSVDTP